eukprot:Skav235603  [mRNA]  locus=scaffold3336:62397:75127:+ [translate_table: standard]
METLAQFKEDPDPVVQNTAESVLEHLQLSRECSEGIEVESDAICKALSSKSTMKRQLNRASTLPANKIALPVSRRPPQRSTTQANMDPAASATASVVVVARIRPKLPKEDKEPDGVEVYSDSQTLSIYSNQREKKQYTLDQVFDSRWKMHTARSARSNDSVEGSPRPTAAEHASQSGSLGQLGAAWGAKFFNDFGRNLVTHSLKGYNVCVFAYGHTGSGKTYTMLGDAAGSGRGAAAGLLPRFLIELFQEHEDAPRPDTWRCSCEFFEVYNEQIRDLLQPNAQVQKPKRVHCHPKHGARIEGLTMSVVSSAEEVMELLHFGNQMRPPPPPQARGKERRVTIAAPPPADDGGGSCMSHGLRGQGFEGLEEPTSHVKRSRIGRFPLGFGTGAVTFVDLAGREERERLGNHPGALQYKEMCFINTNFAASAKKIQTKPIVNSKSATEKLAELENEVHSLQVELAQSKTSNTEKALQWTGVCIQVRVVALKHVSAEKQSGFRHLLHVGALATALAIFGDKSSLAMIKGLVSTTSFDGLSRLQRTYLAAYLCAMMADWLQGPFVYALYASYGGLAGFTREENASLFVAGFGSSAVFGTFVGSLADKYGRRNFAATWNAATVGCSDGVSSLCFKAFTALLRACTACSTSCLKLRMTLALALHCSSLPLPH